jgi:hypothetical protein
MSAKAGEIPPTATYPRSEEQASDLAQYPGHSGATRRIRLTIAAEAGQHRHFRSGTNRSVAIQRLPLCKLRDPTEYTQLTFVFAVQARNLAAEPSVCLRDGADFPAVDVDSERIATSCAQQLVFGVVDADSQVPVVDLDREAAEEQIVRIARGPTPRRPRPWRRSSYGLVSASSKSQSRTARSQTGR